MAVQMKYVGGITQKIVGSLKGKKWYHQRFDGAPYLLHYIAEAEILTEETKKKNLDFSVHICFVENERADWYILMDDIKRVSGQMIRLSKKNSDVGKGLMKKWKKSEKRFMSVMHKVNVIRPKYLNNKKLLEYHDSYLNSGLKNFSSSSIIDGFALGTDVIIADKITKILEKNGRIKEFPRIFSKLTAPVHPSFVNEAEVSLYRIGRLISENIALKRSFRNDSVQVLTKKIEKNKILRSLIDRHVKNYFWSKNNYVTAKYLDRKFFICELRESIMHGMNFVGEIERINNTPKNNSRKKKKLMAEMNIGENLSRLLRISEDFTHWQDMRKKTTYLNAHYSYAILGEIGRRWDFTIDDMKYMLPGEVSIIDSKIPNKKEIAERKKFCAVVWHKKGYEILTGKNARKLQKMVLNSMKSSAMSDIRGLCACSGKARGTVRIIKSATEVGKIKNGDILVAVMTRPDYIAGMKKASAIITSEGGITSHAAIVSRELEIPCVIGTKIATEVLHDGDEVEVNADHGWIKVIKSANERKRKEKRGGKND